jgi:hypothetical protein
VEPEFAVGDQFRRRALDERESGIEVACGQARVGRDGTQREGAQPGARSAAPAVRSDRKRAKLTAPALAHPGPFVADCRVVPLLFRVVRYLPVARHERMHGTAVRAGVGQPQTAGDRQRHPRPAPPHPVCDPEAFTGGLLARRLRLKSGTAHSDIPAQRRDETIAASSR